MDKRKIANIEVKDKLLSALIELMGKKEWSKITITELIDLSGVARVSYYRNFKSLEDLMEYGLEKFGKKYHNESPVPVENFHSKKLIEYNFRFYKENSEMILAVHHSKAPMTLLGIITDCVIYSNGDMSINSISKYELYYYAGAFYNMMLIWLEGGAKESPEDMAEEFLFIANKYVNNNLG